MENKRELMEQLQLEMIIAKENNDDDLYQKLLLVQEKLQKELDIDEAK